MTSLALDQVFYSCQALPSMNSFHRIDDSEPSSEDYGSNPSPTKETETTLTIGSAGFSDSALPDDLGQKPKEDPLDLSSHSSWAKSSGAKSSIKPWSRDSRMDVIAENLYEENGSETGLSSCAIKKRAEQLSVCLHVCRSRW